MRRILFLAACFSVLCWEVSAQKIHLISVGIADYPGTENDLTLPAKDAEAIQWVYQKNRKAETILLTNEQATRNSVLANMNKLFSKAGVMISLFSFSVDMDIKEDLLGMMKEYPIKT